MNGYASHPDKQLSAGKPGPRPGSQMFRAGKWGHSSIPSKRGQTWVGGRAFRGLTRSAPSKSRALRKLPDGNFRRPLVGSLRALTSAKMVALMCIAAARTGFLLAALHSVAERVNPRKPRPPAPHRSPLASQRGMYPFTAGVGKSRESRSLRSSPPLGAHASLAIEWERSCRS